MLTEVKIRIRLLLLKFGWWQTTAVHLSGLTINRSYAQPVTKGVPRAAPGGDQPHQGVS